MRYRVTTEELLSQAGLLDDLVGEAQVEQVLLSDQAAGASTWCSGHAVQAAQAFFDTLAWADAGAADGLADLGRRTAAAGGAYDGAERSFTSHR